MQQENQSQAATGAAQRSNKRVSVLFTFIYLALPATIALFFYSMYKRRIHVDLAILADPTYWLAHEGVLRSELQRGWQHAEEHFFFTHKLFLYIGAMWSRLWGWSSVTLNSLSLVYLTLLVCAWAAITRLLHLEWKWFFLFFLLLLTNHHIFELSFVYRPEIAVAAFSSWCFYFLNRYLSDKKTIFLLFAAIVAGFGVGHHLNGVVIVISGFFLLLFYRQFAGAILFGAVGSLGLGYYLIDIRSLQDFQLMVSQFRNMQDIQPVHSSWIHYALNIPYEQKRFFHSPVEIVFSALVIPLFALNWRYLWMNYQRFVIYAGCGILALALISHDKDTKYLTLHIPILTFLVVILIRKLYYDHSPSAKPIRNFMLPFFVVSFFLGEWRSNLPLTLIKDPRTESYTELTRELPAGTHVLGPVYSVFWAIPHGIRLQAFVVYQVLASHGAFVIDTTHLAQALDDFQIDAILVDADATTRFHIEENSFPKFHLTKEDPANSLRLFQRMTATP
jgi:hypothetical protein